MRMGKIRFSTSAIDFELLDTWPVAIHELFSNSTDVLAGYEKRTRQIDRLIHHGAVEERWKRHENVFEKDRKDIQEKVDVILSSCDLMGYHCTRLFPYEREEIIQSGLSRPSREFLRIEFVKLKPTDIFPNKVQIGSSPSIRSMTL